MEFLGIGFDFLVLESFEENLGKMESLYDCILIRFVENCFPFIIGFLDSLHWPLSSKKEEGSLCKVVIYNYVFCWLLFRAKFDCNFIQSFVPCIYCGI